MIRYKSCGIDVSADVFDAGLWVKNKRQTCRFPNNPSGFDALRSWLKSFCIHRAWFVIEHTGGYERALALYLVDMENQVSLVDGLKVQRFKESCGAKAKTDAGDALFLAKYGAQHQPPMWVPLPNAYQELLELVRHRQSLVGDLTRWKNRRAAPCTNEFVHAQHETIIEVLRLQIEQAEAAVRACVQSDPELAQSVVLLCTTSGIKEVTATAFIAEAGPIWQYPTPESLALEAGLAPLPHLSGRTAKGTLTPGPTATSGCATASTCRPAPPGGSTLL